MHKVLIIDDDTQMRLFMETALKKAGYEVFTAGDGVAGLREYQATTPHLVICDLFMPEKEGLETIGELRRLEPHVKILAISGGSRTTPINFLPAAKHLGAQKTLAKPFGRDELLTAVAQLLQG